MSEILKITNGTDEVTLIGANSTFRVVKTDGYIPGIAEGKPTWHTPALGNGRQLQAWAWNNVIDSYKLFMKSSINQDTAAGELRSLIQLLVQAVQYRPTEWNSTPVYMTRKADNATNTEYALIEAFTMPGFNSPFSYLFKQLKMKGLQLTLELGQWGDVPPNSSTATPIGTVETFDSRNYGNINSAGATDHTTGEEVFFTGGHTIANITNIHIGTGGSNLIDASLPVNIIGSTGSTYFGGPVPFSNLIFDIGLAAAGTYTLVWEYWDGAAWSSAINLVDNTSNFTTTGVSNISFGRPNGWTENSPGGGLPTQFWVRCRVASGSLSTQPRQQNRRVYTANWPHVDILADNVKGDLPALTTITIKNVSDDGDPFGTGQGSHFFIGTRSLSRGSQFISQLNISDEQVPSGITVTDHSSGTFEDHPKTTTGRRLSYSTSSASAHFCSVLLDDTIANDYTGRFRVFVVLYSVNWVPAAQWGVSLKVNLNSAGSYLNGDTIFESETITITSNSFVLRPLDMGELHIPTTPGTSLKNIRFLITSRMNDVPGATMTMKLGRIILIPVDESAAYVTAGSLSENNVTINQYLEINSTQTKQNIFALLKNGSDDTLLVNWKTNSNGPLLIQANSDQRLHILPIWLNGIANSDQVAFDSLYSIQLAKRQQYLTLRGDS